MEQHGEGVWGKRQGKKGDCRGDGVAGLSRYQTRSLCTANHYAQPNVKCWLSHPGPLPSTAPNAAHQLPSTPPLSSYVLLPAPAGDGRA